MNADDLKAWLLKNKDQFVRSESYTYDLSDVTQQTDTVEIVDFEALLRAIDEFAATFK